MRDFGVKARLAQEFVGFTGSQKEFRKLMGEKDPSSDRYHRIYPASEIRAARIKLMGLPADIQRPNEIPPIINCRMSKGGTGKTTVAANIASTLAMRGYRVLMIDGDPQASLTTMFGIDWAQEDITHIGELIFRNLNGKPVQLDQAVRPIYSNNMLDLIASDITLTNADAQLLGIMNRENCFHRLLEAQTEFFAKYDVIVIDSAPGTTILTNALMYPCSTILAVVRLDGGSIKAMQVLSSNIQEMNTAFKKNMTAMIVANGYHHGYPLIREALATLASAWPGQVYDEPLPHSSSFMRQMDLFSDEASGPILEREQNSVAARSIIDLTKALVSYYDIRLAGHSTMGTNKQKVANA